MDGFRRKAAHRVEPGMVEITIRIKLMLEVLYQTIYKDIPPLTAALEKIVPTEAEK